MSRQQSGRAAKVRALAERAGTVGEHASVAPAAAKRRPFTDADARRLAAPEKGNRVFFDVKPSGFGVRVTAAGSRAFVFDYRVRGSGQQRRHTIGKVGDWNIGAARAEAQRLRRLVDSGGDPRGDL